MRDYFDKELRELNDQLIEMGVLIENAIKKTTDIIVHNKPEEIETAKEQEEKINAAEKSIQSHCLKLLLHQAPVASDLRTISAALKMITDMERIGDQAFDIAEMSEYIGDENSFSSMTDLALMAEKAAEMVTTAIDAFVRKDIELARSVAVMDDDVDELFNNIKSELVEIIHSDKESGSKAIDIAMIAKYLERIGDHAVNIAEWVKFSITGSNELGI